MQFTSPQKCIQGGSGCNLAYPLKTWFSVSLEQTRLILTFHAQRALMAKHGEESRARKDMVLEGNHSQVQLQLHYITLHYTTLH